MKSGRKPRDEAEIEQIYAKRTVRRRPGEPRGAAVAGCGFHRAEGCLGAVRAGSRARARQAGPRRGEEGARRRVARRAGTAGDLGTGDAARGRGAAAVGARPVAFAVEAPGLRRRRPFDSPERRMARRVSRGTFDERARPRPGSRYQKILAEYRPQSVR